MGKHSFHPEALLEYADATDYYLYEASAETAEDFMAAVESAIHDVLASPTRWRVIERPDVRRYIFRHFPFVLYYRWESEQGRVTIYAIMHCSRDPDYWKGRIG